MADSVKDYETQFGLTNDHVTAVGSYIITWNYVELQFEVVAVAASGFQQGQIEALIGGPNVPANMNAFIALVEATMNAEPYLVIREDVISCAKKMKEMSNFRNEVAHGRWVMNMDQPQQFKKQDGSIVVAGTLASTKRLTTGANNTLEKLESELANLQKIQYRLQDALWRCIAVRNPSMGLPSPFHDKF